MATAKKNLKATWVATVTNLDWPSVSSLAITDEAARVNTQKEELTSILDDLVAMKDTKKVLAAELIEDTMARWNELKAFEDEKWKTKLAVEERKLKAEERGLALEKERIRDAKKAVLSCS